MSSSNRRRDNNNSPRGNHGSAKLRMDRLPVVTRITDPSLPAGKRKEIDNVMKKARASTNDYWDKKLLEVEEKDPNRWRHTGYKKLYIEGDTSSESERDNNMRFNNRTSNNRNSRSRSRNRRTPPQSPLRKRTSRSPDLRRRTSKSPDPKRRSPRSPDLRRRSPRSPDLRRRPRSPMDPPMKRKLPRSPRSPRMRSPRSPIEVRRRSPPPSPMPRRRSPITVPVKVRAPVLPRSKRPPSPPPKHCGRSPSNSSLSSCSDDACSVCSSKQRRARSRSRSVSLTRTRPLPRSPLNMPSKPSAASGHGHGHNRMSANAAHPSLLPPPTGHGKQRQPPSGTGGLSTHHITSSSSSSTSSRLRPISPQQPSRDDKHLKNSRVKHRGDEKLIHSSSSTTEKMSRLGERPMRHIIGEPEVLAENSLKNSRIGKARLPEDPRLKIKPPEPPEPAPANKKHKTKSIEKLRAKVKIEGEKHRKQRSSSSGSEDSSSSESSLPRFTATTRLTLSERFGKMAQWSIDRSNMENMRITKDSAGGALKVMIEEGLESPPRRYSYSPAPPGHFPEELSMTAPSGLLSWDDVRVRYEYYKSRGYLRDLDLQDYIKWEEWWYKYQEWLKQERYYEFWERQQLNRRRRKKVPITQRLN